MTTNTPTLSDKQIAAEAVGRMPETVTLAEISENLAILAGLAKGQRDIDEGRFVTHEEAKRRLMKSARQPCHPPCQTSTQTATPPQAWQAINLQCSHVGIVCGAGLSDTVMVCVHHSRKVQGCG
jgi:predicted transcriptional regulator